MDNWAKLQKAIETETKSYFKGKHVNIPEIVTLLRKILSIHIDDQYKLSGVGIRIPKAVFVVLDENTTKKDRAISFVDLCKVEPFLKVLLYLLNFEAFCEIERNKKGLYAIIQALNLNNQNIDFADINTNDCRMYTDYNYHLFKVYNLRNTESHNMESWSSRELSENIESILIFYIEVINKHKDALKNAISNQDNNYLEYISSVITEFESNSKRFISTESIEDMSVFESYAIEHKNTDLENEDDQGRSGTVDYIRKEQLPEKRMLLWGDAGMGKSTTLQYLTYIDARDYLEGKTNAIPVYIPLGMMINQDETLEQHICRKIGIEYLTGVDLFKSGKVSLYLDGVNEISADNSTGIQIRRLKEIQSLLNNYPHMLIIISNRPNGYSYINKIPVFRLQKMGLKTIKEFLEKNAEDEKVREKIMCGIESNHRLLQIVGTPLMATRLIEIVRDLKEFPQSEGTIIKKFLESLYKREKFEKKDTRFEESIIHDLLVYLAYYGFYKNETNTGLSRHEVLRCFAECMEKYHFSYDSTYALEILINLGVLNSDKDKQVIVFSHQAYQDYYLSCSDQIDIRNFSDPNMAIGTMPSKEKATEDDNEVKQQPKQEFNLKSEIEDYYRQYAHDEKHEKSIIYRLHTSDRETRNRNIVILAKYNLLLAAKAISSGEEDPEIEEFIVKKTVEKTLTSPSADIQIESILVFLELDRSAELKESISILLKNHKEGVKNISAITTQLSGDQCVAFMDALSQQRDDPTLLNAISSVVSICRMKDYEYSWNSDNQSRIYRIANRLNKLLESSPFNLLLFYLSFNVPKEYMINNLTYYIDSVVLKHYVLVEEFVSKQNIEYDLSPDRMIHVFLHSRKQRAIQQAMYMLSNMDKPVRDKVIYANFSEAKNLRKVIFHQMNDQDQYIITKRFNIFYYVSHKSRLKSFHFLSDKDAHDLVFDNGLLQYYEIDANHITVIRDDDITTDFAEYLRKNKPKQANKTNNEVLSTSNFEDFLLFKAKIDEYSKQRKQKTKNKHPI